MISISLSNVTLILGAKTIFNNLNFEVQHDQKIGLVGANGSGKTSLLKLIMSEHRAEPGGALTLARGVSMGIVSQHPDFDSQRSAFSLVQDGNPRIAALESELQTLEARMGLPEVFNNPRALERALERQDTLLAEYDALGGATVAARARELLTGLGLPPADLEKPAGFLSGGQKKLVAIARLLILQPQVLLLDEPDNHLDIPAKAFLERLIRDYQGAVVIISHDRYLLDAVVTHIAELEDGRLNVFSGNYTEYYLDKEARTARQEELFFIQQRAIKRMELALKRYQLWAQVSDKFASRVRSMRSRLEKTVTLDAPGGPRRQMGLELGGWRGSNQVLQLIGLKKAYPGRVLLGGVDLLVRHGERVGLIGANGAGKSVLLRLILGQELPDDGEVRLGPAIKSGYYAQEHDTLDFELTPAEIVRRTANLTEASAVALLIRYLFTYQQCTQKISTLSGGERSRLQLALVVLSGANFLLLDEPTNNLDIASAEVLENALANFTGTVLVISHDRYFLDRCVDRIIELKDGRLWEYIGGYSDYIEKKMAAVR